MSADDDLPDDTDTYAAIDYEGDPYGRPAPIDTEALRRAELTPAEFEHLARDNAPGDPRVFRAVVEQAQGRAVLADMDGRPDPAAPWSTPASFAPADAALITYAAACRACVPDGSLGIAPEHPSVGLAIPFASQADRDRWALGHARDRGHTLTLIEQHPGTGSTITGTCEPEPGDGPPPAERPAPLVAFVVRDGSPPDMLVRIPPRAAAAWLLTAAHAALLGRGSLGVDQPHRALYVGRMSRDGDRWQVRIDGLLGATGDRFGDAIGMVCTGVAKLSPTQIEDVCETLIAQATDLTRNLFSVVIMTDAPPAAPPDDHADAVLRGERLAGLRRRGDGCVPEAPGG